MANKHMKICSILYIIKKCKLRQDTHLLEWPKSTYGTQTTSNADKDMKQQEFSFTSGKSMQNNTATLEDNFGHFLQN